MTAVEKAALVAHLRREANANRVRHGLPAWHWRLARPVPGCGNPPV